MVALGGKAQDAESGDDEWRSPTKGSLLPRAKIDIEGLHAAFTARHKKR